MKIRNGFISNSSSSSFIVAIEKKLNWENEIEDIFKISKKSPFFDIVKSIGKILFNRNEKHFTSWEQFSSFLIKEFEEDITYIEEKFKEIKQFCLEKLEKNEPIEIFYGIVANDNGGIESTLCSITIDCKTEKVIIKKDEVF